MWKEYLDTDMFVFCCSVLAVFSVNRIVFRAAVLRADLHTYIRSSIGLLVCMGARKLEAA